VILWECFVDDTVGDLFKLKGKLNQRYKKHSATNCHPTWFEFSWTGRRKLCYLRRPGLRWFRVSSDGEKRNQMALNMYGNHLKIVEKHISGNYLSLESCKSV